jgi:hypothetical protein
MADLLFKVSERELADLAQYRATLPSDPEALKTLLVANYRVQRKIAARLQKIDGLPARLIQLEQNINVGQSYQRFAHARLKEPNLSPKNRAAFSRILGNAHRIIDHSHAQAIALCEEVGAELCTRYRHETRNFVLEVR